MYLVVYNLIIGKGRYKERRGEGNSKSRHSPHFFYKNTMAKRIILNRVFFNDQLDMILNNEEFNDWDILYDSIVYDIKETKAKLPLALRNLIFVKIKLYPYTIDRLDLNKLEFVFQLCKNSPNFKNEARAMQERLMHSKKSSQYFCYLLG